jgi:hypothetical protein
MTRVYKVGFEIIERSVVQYGLGAIFGGLVRKTSDLWMVFCVC